MSKQSDGLKQSSSLNTLNKDMLKDYINNTTFVIGDCEVDCIMRLFQPRSITYTDYTDWNYDCT